MYAFAGMINAGSFAPVPWEEVSMRNIRLPMAQAAILGFGFALAAQQVVSPDYTPPSAPLPRYIYNVVSADYAVAAGEPLVKSKFSVYDPVGIQTFDANVAKMSELNLNTYRIEIGWGRGRGGAGGGTHGGPGGTPDHLVYDFDPLDHLVQQLKAQDVQLLGAYGYTPLPLQDASLPARSEEGKQRADTPPRDLARWKEIVTAHVRHYREIGIPFGVNEVWNEPDGTYGFFSGTEEQYEQLYKATVEAVRSADPDAVVAGPGSDHHILWNKTFVDFVVKNQLPLDYYSFHEYGSGELAVRQVERTAASLNRYASLNTTALSLDEWFDGECCTWCADDVRNHYQAAPELLHDFTLLLDRPELASVSWAWWLDPAGRGGRNGANGGNGNGGCMGLITSDGRRKATFNAWKLYAMMPVDRREVKAEGELESVASSDDHKASLLIWNRSPYERRVDVHMKSLPFQHGTARMYRVDGKHASALDSGDDSLKELESYPLGSAEWSYLDGHIAGNGIMYFEATDGSGISELTPARVADVIRINRYYPARGTTRSYADFDRKTWIARLGMMGENADQQIGVLASILPDSLNVTTRVDGKLQKVDADSALAMRVDYRVNGKYAKAIWLHGPYDGLDLFDKRKKSGVEWGLKAEVDQVVALPDFASFEAPLKAYAPPNWKGEAHIALVMQNAGPTARAKITLRAGNAKGH
jgi:xylan 1,4-beta-xylosidase